MKKYIFADYNNSLVNLIASIGKSYGLEMTATSLELLDRELAKNYRSVVLLLLDGMGSFIMDKHLSKDSFLQRKKVADYSSVFPSTTAAATTVLTSGKSPIETGWLGWHQYLPQVDHDVILFTGRGYYDERLEEPNPAYKYLSYETFVQRLRNKGIEATTLYPKWSKENPTRSKGAFFRQIKRFVKRGQNRQYLYAYWDNPDHLMHEFGTDDLRVKKMLRDVDKRIERLSKKLPADALLIVTADHGHHDVKSLYLNEYPDFLKTLVRLPSIDSRNSTFFVREDKNKEFEALFEEYFASYFLLIKKEDVLKQKLFGLGSPHPLALDFIGDYQAVAIDDYQFSYKSEDDKANSFEMKAAHAGILEDEMIIPLILIHR